MTDVLKKIGEMGLVPVVVMENAEHAIPAAKALMDGGLNVMEITLRTEAGLPAIKKVKQALPDMLLGAGTVLSIQQAGQALEAGAEFIVSPGLNPELVEWCKQMNTVITPGCVTPTEIEQALKYELKVLKFFPASVYGGFKACKALHDPYRMIKFIPTGGIDLSNLQDYAASTFIHAIGGGWLCKQDDIKNEKFDSIRAIASQSINALLGFELIGMGKDLASGGQSTEPLEHLAKAFGFTFDPSNATRLFAEHADTSSADVTLRTNNIDRAWYYLQRRGLIEKPIQPGMAETELKPEFGMLKVQLVQR